MNNKIITSDGYIELRESGNTWVGVEAHLILYHFNQTVRQSNGVLTGSNLELRVFAKELRNKLTN